MKHETETEKVILNAAKKVFQDKGLYGARMQEIADVAKINKAMLHYYFRSKDKLFDAVFEEIAKTFFVKIRELMDIKLPLFKKIEFFVENYITLLIQNPHIPVFVITEVYHNPNRIKKLFISNRITLDTALIGDIKLAVKQKKIKPIDPIQLLINIIALCIFPIVTKPIISIINNYSEKEYNKFLESRKKEVAKFIINSIKLN